MENEISGLFPNPVYSTERNSELDVTEKKEIEDIIAEGVCRNINNVSSINKSIFDTKLKNIKGFCEQHLKIYVEQVIVPKEELEFYITQSWLSITESGGSHHEHSHPNSIISGVFYISTVENDGIVFSDPNIKQKKLITIETEDYNIWNSSDWTMPVYKNQLFLFPSWLFHRVEPNPNATTNRISLSFNVFLRGKIGSRENTTELILK
jgi:uncharacterized protein (TIGR02466 family)